MYVLLWMNVIDNDILYYMTIVSPAQTQFTLKYPLLKIFFHLLAHNPATCTVPTLGFVVGNVFIVVVIEIAVTAVVEA
jgi:hypothetical protein